MADILVRNIEEVVADRIKAVARERQWSINEVILHVLKQGLGFGGDEDIFHRAMHDIAVLSGAWDARETAAFRSAVEAFERRRDQPLFSDTPADAASSNPEPAADPDEDPDQEPK